MPKTLYIARSFPPDVGGAQTLSLERCKSHIPASHIIVLAPDTQGAASFDAKLPFRVFRWPYSTSWPRLLRYFLLVTLPVLWAIRIVISEKIEIVECSQALPNSLAALVVKMLFGTYTVVWALGNEVFRPSKSLIGRTALRISFKYANRIVAISYYTKQAVEDLFPMENLPPDKLVVIHPPADRDRFNPFVDGENLRIQLGLENRFVVLTVARLVERKGVDVMFAALPRILFDDPRVVYVIVGDGHMRNYYQQQAQILGIQESVVFAGRVSDQMLPEYYAMADLIVLLSQSWPELGDVEGYGIVLREAGLCGKPVIGSREGGIVDAVIDGITGYLVDPKDNEEVARTILLLARDAKLCRDMGRHGYSVASADTPWHLVIPSSYYVDVSENVK